MSSDILPLYSSKLIALYRHHRFLFSSFFFSLLSFGFRSCDLANVVAWGEYWISRSVGRVTIIQNKFRQITSLLPYFVTYQASSMEHKSTPFKHLSFNYNSFVWFFPAHCVCVQFEFSTFCVMADIVFILSVCFSIRRTIAASVTNIVLA